MQPTKSALILSMVLAPLSLTACLGELAVEEEGIAEVQQASLEDNGLTTNGLTTNGLTTNGLTTNGLTTNGLTTNGLTRQTLSDDPLSRQFLGYVVNCALRADQQFTLALDSASYTFTGQLGLAPSWGAEGGSCDETCRALVSSCVLARVNYLGQRVPLSLRGNAGVLAASSAERMAYPNREASYYGDVFSSPQKRYACTSPGSTLITRVCGPDWVPGAACVMNVVGDCSAKCDSVDATEGAYANCHDELGGTYPNPITVFRQ